MADNNHKPHSLMMSDNLLLGEERPQRSDAQKNRALLLETARRLFDQMGVEAVSMSAIAETAGVGKGTLYRHFENKQQLCEALLDEDQRALQERTFARMRTPGDPLGKLRWFVNAVIGFVALNEPLLCGGMESGSAISLMHPAHAWWRQTITALLQQIQPDQDIPFLTDVIYMLIDVRNLRYQMHHRGYSIERVADGIFGLIRL